LILGPLIEEGSMTRSRFVLPIGVVAGVSMLLTAQVPAQTPTPAGRSAAKWVTPRTAWDDPDLQGIWPSSEMIGVPLQRDPALGTRAYLTDEEFAQRQKQASRQAEGTARSLSLRAAAAATGPDPPAIGASAAHRSVRPR
jgi:hypothetical protein